MAEGAGKRDRRREKAAEADPAIARVAKFAHENVKTVTTTVFHVFRKLEKGVNVLSRDKT